MDSKEYILKHDFGYGRNPETKIINKLELRNIKDLKVYIDDVLENCFLDYEKNSFILNDKKIIIKDI